MNSRELTVDFLREKGLNCDYRIKGGNFNNSLLSLLREFWDKSIKNHGVREMETRKKYYRLTGEINIYETFTTDKKVDEDKISRLLQEKMEVVFDEIMHNLGYEGEEVHGLLVDYVTAEDEEV